MLVMTAESGKKGPAPAAAWWTQPPVSTPTKDVSSARDPTRLAKPKRAQLVTDSDPYSPLRCPVCARAHPPDAYYCYFDGKPLHKDLQQAPLQVGKAPFPAPFCFANGQACTNFNQLALTCNNLWEDAKELLASGIWSTFFTSMGRLDLAAIAKHAAKEPDPDRGLSQLLEKFPADPEFLRPPKLALAANEIVLEQLSPGTDYSFDLVIQNQGMLLLHGIVLSNFDWLVFGEGARPSEKMFQTRLGCTIPVRVLGSKLRAGLKPLLGEIIIDTNGGTISVPVRVDIPVRPFPKGYANEVLAGVRSPRDLAVRAKKSPKEAGLLFEQGAVKAWYASNGWTYPIKGADGQGVAAVQQFFEALGLTEPPRLEVAPTTLALKGKAGQTLSACLTIRTQETKPVYAQAYSDRNWLKIGPLKYLGTKVEVPIEIVVPGDQGENARAHVTIQGNGNQQFVVPVTVAVKNMFSDLF
jgi:hypothetical protein